MKHPQTADAPKAKKSRKVAQLVARAQVRAPANEIAAWMRLAAAQGRSLSNWIRRLANEAVRAAADAE